MALLAASQQPQTLPVLLIVMLLIAQALATACLGSVGCSQPVSRPTCHRCETVGLHAGNFLKNVFLVTTTPLDIKHSRCFANGLNASVCKISPLYMYNTQFRKTYAPDKQTLKYLVDNICMHVVLMGHGEVSLVRQRPVWTTNHPPSVIWHCWLGFQTCETLFPKSPKLCRVADAVFCDTATMHTSCRLRY